MSIYPWQEKQWRALLQAYQQKRLSHAYFLTGVSGLGKTDFAHAFAAFLLCEDSKKTNTACGHCRGCQWFKAETHPDFMSIFPEEKGRVIKIDQVRALTQKITQTAQRGGYQVVLMSPADAMPAGAANALLKTLEEPSGQVVILLVGSQAHRLPATIMSRCQKIIFSGDQADATVQWLQRECKADQDVSMLLKLSGNAPLKVRHFIETDYLNFRDTILQHVMQLRAHTVNAISPVTNWLKQGVDTVFHVLLTLCIDMSRVQQQVNARYLINADRHTKIQKMAKEISPLALQQLIDLILKKKSLLATGMNLNPQLCLENVLIQWEKSC